MYSELGKLASIRSLEGKRNLVQWKFYPGFSDSDWRFQVHHADYTNSGYDRVHMCPSDDRNSMADENRTTLLLSNVVPQVPILNRQAWQQLEDYTRDQLSKGNECYIIAGTYGKGGTSDAGPANELAEGTLRVPAAVWKVVFTRMLIVGVDSH